MESNQLIPGRRYTLPYSSRYTGEFKRLEGDNPTFKNILPIDHPFESCDEEGVFGFWMYEDITEVQQEPQPEHLSITITATIPNQDNIGELAQLIILSLKQNTILDNIKVTVR